MIKNIFFLAAIVVSANFSAQTQTFQFNDHNDVNIGGTVHYEIKNGSILGLTKFHVKNVSAATASYTADVRELSNPKGSDLQVCYGTACYTANAGVAMLQAIGDSSTVVSNATDGTFKVAPFSGAWVAGDSAVWRVTVRNVANPADTVSATIIWKADATTVVEKVSSNNIELIAYPNPASDFLTIKYNLNGTSNVAELNVYDVLGQKVLSINLNGNKGSEKLDLDAINSGVYFYTVKIAGENVRTERFIVK